MTIKKIIPYPKSNRENGETMKEYFARCDAALKAADKGAEFVDNSEDVTDQHLGEMEVTYVPNNL